MTKPHEINADWLAWSVDLIPWITERELWQQVTALIRSTPGITRSQNPVEFSRKPYNEALQIKQGGKVFYSTKHSVPHATFEVEGKGCRKLEDTGKFDVMAWHVLDTCLNVTRFDLAVDIETSTMPVDFAAMRNQRYKTEKIFNSPDGQTVYVGSKDGSRYVRVYRWSEPHERAHLLRVEFVFSKPDAKGALERYLTEPAEDFAGSCGDIFGFSHPDWNLTGKEPIKAWRPERGKASTLRWFETQVLSAMADAYDTELMDAQHPFWARLAEVTPLEYTFSAGDAGLQTTD